MLCAKRKSDGQIAIATYETRSGDHFAYPECDGEVVLRMGSVRLNHFAHRAPLDCRYGTGESDAHRRCKMEIYQALLREPGVTKAALERPLKTNRPDVSAYINGVPVAIEVQISTLTMETIIRRTEEYARKGIYVLWLAQWTPYLDGVRYSPRLWEKWLHAAYFGRVYYWKQGLEILSYRFQPVLQRVPERTWREGRRKVTVGGYTRNSKRYRASVPGNILNLVKDFRPTAREAWQSGGYTIPAAKLFTAVERKQNEWQYDE